MKKLGIVGYGNMGSAIAQRLQEKYRIWAFDKDKNKIRNLAGINIAKDIGDLISKVEILILAVKPQDFDAFLAEVRGYSLECLLISIATGISTDYIANYLGKKKIIRVVPNLPSKIGKGMVCLCKGRYASQEDLELSQDLFANLGQTLVLNEDMMDAATAISGSGPGFLFDMAEDKDITQIKNYAESEFIISLAQAAQKLGFSLQQAELLARNTAAGSIALLEVSGLTPSELKRQVASKGGTTQAGLEVLHSGGSLEEAVKAAKRRAEELAKKE